MEELVDSPQPVTCEPIWEALEEEIAPVPTKCDVIEYDAPYESEPMDTEPLKQRVSNRRRLQASHILEGNGWRSCEPCRDTTERLALQVPISTEFGVDPELSAKRKDHVGERVEAGCGKGRGRRRRELNTP